MSPHAVRKGAMPSPEDRIRYIDHEGEKVLLVDMSHTSPQELGTIASLVPEYVTEHPMGSVLLLADFTGATFDKNCVEKLKVAMVLDKPRLKKAAWVGTDTLPKVFFENMQMFAQRQLTTFASREEALRWLVGEE